MSTPKNWKQYHSGSNKLETLLFFLHWTSLKSFLAHGKNEHMREESKKTGFINTKSNLFKDGLHIEYISEQILLKNMDIVGCVYSRETFFPEIIIF